MLALRNSLRAAHLAPSLRQFSVARVALAHGPAKDISPAEFKQSNTLREVQSSNDLFGPGPKPNSIPTDLDITTGVERLELLANMEGISLFDDQPLIQDRKGTVEDPFIIDSWSKVRYVGCTGFPAGSQDINWLRVEDGKLARDWESGCVYKLNYLGPPDHEGGVSFDAAFEAAEKK